MASSLTIRTTIATAYAALDNACDAAGLEASTLLRKATDAALNGEKTHRRHGPSSRYKQSAETAARYFVCKWFLDPAKVKDARQAAALRLDCLYSSALRAVLAEQPGSLDLVAKLAPISDLDYCNDIVGAR